MTAFLSEVWEIFFSKLGMTFREKGPPIRQPSPLTTYEDLLPALLTCSPGRETERKKAIDL